MVPCHCCGRQFPPIARKSIGRGRTMMMMMTVALTTLVLLLLAADAVSLADKGTTTKDADDGTTTAPNSSNCGLWVAPSTIPNAGLGAFNGDRYLPRGAGGTGVLDVDQVAVPLVDMEFHNGNFRGVGALIEHRRNNWREFLMNFFISTDDFDLDDSFPPDTHMLVPGTGSLPCSHFALNNVKEPSYLLIDTLEMHRSTDPGVGAFSPYHGYQCPTTRSIPAYAEIFGSYGAAWFEEREKTIGIVPMEEDWEEADRFFRDYTKYWALYQSELTETMAEELWTLALSEDVDDFDVSLKAFVQQYSSVTKALSKEMVDALIVLLNKAMELDVAAAQALPRSWESAQKAMTAGGLVPYELQKSTRSKEWLQTHGRCMDGIIPGVSSIPQAARGAFARRSFSQGEIVAHAPLLHIIDRSMLTIYASKETEDERDVDRPMGFQLVLNYCFGRRTEESPLLLCPYGSSTPYINHHSDEANVKVVWATNTSWFDPKCLTMTPVELGVQQFSTCLAVDYIALKEIADGDEILLDYGTDWDEAWKKHVKSWEPHPIFALEPPLYVRSHELNGDKTSPIRTLQEEDGGDPYPSNVRIGCRHPTKKAWYECDILERKEMEHRKGQFEYVVELTVDDSGLLEEMAEDEEEEVEGDSGEDKIERFDHLQRKYIRFFDEWYSGDEFLPNAFRHEMRLPDELFSESWRTSAATTSEEETKQGSEIPSTTQTATSTTNNNNATEECTWIDDEEVQYDFVSSPHLEPGQIEPIRWSDTKETANKYSVRIGLDPRLSQELLAYAERLGIVDMYWDLLQRKEPMKPGSFEFFQFDPNDPDLKFYVNRPEKKWKSNMHWANAGNEHTHEEYLKVLAKGNFDQVLDAIGNHFGLDGLFVQGVSFIGVSNCEKGYVHHDMTETGGKFFNVLFPLVQVDNAPPEFILRDDQSGVEGLAKYIANEAMAVGDDAYHGTAACDYQTGANTGIRVSASVYIADVNTKNVDEIISDDTTIFPIPFDRDWVMASRARHWGGENRLVGDKGRRPITVKDQWNNCEELAQSGACEKDIWSMRANCVKTCRVFLDE